MDQSTTDVDAMTAPFQLTKTLRRDMYPTVDPKNPALTAHGKVVLVFGAAGGVGGEIARAWAQASAKSIILADISEDGLIEPLEACKKICPDSNIVTVIVDVTDEASVEALFHHVSSTVGTVDVVINSAGTLNGDGKKIGDLSTSQWWRDFEVNVKGTYSIAHFYIKTHGGEGTFIDMVSLGAAFTMPGVSSYSLSKGSAIRLIEYLDAEYPALRAFSVHPGIMAKTASDRGMTIEATAPYAVDKGILTGGVTLYLSTPEAEYLRGGFFCINWDLDELAIHKDEIVKKRLVKTAFLNAKLGPKGHPWGIET